MRHALTYFNLKGINSGHLDVPILKSTITKSQHKYDFVMCSPMIRCRQTLDLLNLDNTPTIYDKRLIEAGYGDLTGMPKNKKVFKRDIFSKPETSKYYLSESIYESGERSLECLIEYTPKLISSNCEDILILAHKNTLSGLWYHLNDFDRNIPEFKNNKIIDIIYDPNKFLNK